MTFCCRDDLFRAISKECLPCVKRIAQQDWSNVSSHNGDTPWHVVTTESKIGLLLALIDSTGKKADINTVNCFRRTALYYAVENGATKIVRLLLACGARVMIECGCICGPLIEGIASGKYDCVELLLPHIPDLNAELWDYGSQKTTPLLAAIGYRQYRLVKLFLRSGANPSWTIRGRSRPIDEACRIGDNRMVRLLLQYGADPYDCAYRQRPIIARAILQQLFPTVLYGLERVQDRLFDWRTAATIAAYIKIENHPRADD